MAKMIGLSRNLKMPWLNKVVEFVEEGFSEAEIKNQLNEYLAFEITSPTNIRKTRELLMNIWVYENPTSKKIKEKGLQLIKKYPEYRMSIHWCEMLSVFPVFMDITTIIGKLAVYEDKFTTAQIRQKLYDEYGERAAILHSSAKLLQTIKDMGAIKQVKTGVYNIQKTKISKPDVVDYMLFTLMQCSQSSYRTIEQLGDFKALFPFDYQVSREQIQMDDDFVYSTFGNEITVALK